MREKSKSETEGKQTGNGREDGKIKHVYAVMAKKIIWIILFSIEKAITYQCENKI